MGQIAAQNAIPIATQTVTQIAAQTVAQISTQMAERVPINVRVRLAARVPAPFGVDVPRPPASQDDGWHSALATALDLLPSPAVLAEAVALLQHAAQGRPERKWNSDGDPPPSVFTTLSYPFHCGDPDC